MRTSKNTGFSLIEILVTIVILMVGLLGLAGLQGYALTSQLESSQRSQALILMKDMAGRVATNRKNAAAYIAAVGTGNACPAAGATIASQDLNQWCNALMGSSETIAGVSNAGAMIGARGCITQSAAPASGVPTQYVVAVAWQGMNKTASPAISCGLNAYGDDKLRRVVSIPVNIADLK